MRAIEDGSGLRKRRPRERRRFLQIHVDRKGEGAMVPKQHWWVVMGALVALGSMATAHADTLSDIREHGEFRLGHRESSAPFSFVDGDGQARGYSVDICLKVYAAVKAELKRPDLALRYVMVKPADRITAVKDGRIDVECGSTTNTVGRQKDVAFSFTTFVVGARFLAKKTSNLKDLADLRGKPVAVTEKTTTETLVRQTSAERNLALKLVLVKDHAEGFAKMDSGEVAAVANDDALLFGLASKAKDPSQYDFVGKYLSVEPYGIMYRKDDPGFARLMDNVIGGLFASGEIRAIHAKWFESGAFRLPMSQYMKENIKLPNKYGVP
ncbi:MAG: amino acid ABC transporter substrate-binding protein [Proteobacteria bacterium]|nr:amino acid ABC transporter substrate-binding protein [Pseudomonadota bacterium]